MVSKLKKVKPLNQCPHYRTRVIQNRQYLKLDGWRLFVIHWLVTLMYAPREAYRGAPMACFGFAGGILFTLGLAFLGVIR
jgi:hypothetical protein